MSAAMAVRPGVVWLEFGLCVLVIGIAGTYLSRYGDVIAEKTGLSGTWIGVILLATVTSLPELITGVSAAALAGVPNIAIGDALGSCVFNLLLITLLDFASRGQSVYRRASQGHILSAGFGVMLISFVGLNVLLARHDDALRIGHIGVYSPMIVLLYAVAMRTVFRYEREHMAAFTEKRAARYPDMTLRQAAARYGGAAAVVIAAGAWLPFVGSDLADVMGWHNTFVGTLFVAFATSVPEIVVSMAALRIDALDMAIGNLFGSNLFDVLVIAVDDLFFFKGPILSFVSPVHAVSVVSAVMMTGLAIVGLLYRPDTRLFKAVGWTSLGLVAFYVMNSYVLFLYGE
jgi:cation:H+ antiporter